MDRYRLIASIVALFIYLLAMFPLQTIVTAAVLLIAYLVLSNMGQGRLGDISTAHNGREVRRRQALNEAKIYLGTYSDIWRNLKLSNTHCMVRLGSDGKTITASTNNKRCKVLSSRVHSYEELWNLLCNVFDHNTTFERLLELFETFNVDVDLKINETTPEEKPDTYIQKNHEIINTDTKNTKEKIDINNASEVELTALPGISIVMAKKLIKKREEINGFQTARDVCLFLHLKPHMENQLLELICVKKMKSNSKMKRYGERSIDL